MYESAALGGEAIFLEAAVRFFGEGSLDQAEFKKLIHPQVEFAGDAAAPECLGQTRLRKSGFFQSSQDSCRERL